MKTKFVPVFGVLLSILGCVCACRPTAQPSTSSLDRSRLCQDATETYMAYVKALKPGAGNDVPSDFWAEGIKALQPVRVYTHRANLVVVQQVTGGIEQGKYIQVPVSSYIPHPGEDDDGFEFRLDSNGVYDFKRVKNF